MSFNPTLHRGPQEECEATWWVQATPGTTYWRCLVPARHLPGQAIEFSKDHLQLDSNEKPFLTPQRGTAIWQFLGDVHRTRIVLGMMQVHGTRTIMELDDDYTRTAPYLKNSRIERPWKDTIAEADGGYSHEMHRLVVPEMDALIVSTEHLANIYWDYHDEIFVCPNSLDMDDWQYDRVEPDGILRICYYGSMSHSTDTPLVKDALKWASKQKDVEIHTIGFVPQDWSFKYTAKPWFNDIVEARKCLFGMDIGVAPLKNTPWARSKSDVKVLEYAAAGVMPLASNVEPYKYWDNVPGVLVNDGDWAEMIRHYVKNRDDVPEQAQIVRDWALNYRTIQESIQYWKEAIYA